MRGQHSTVLISTDVQKKNHALKRKEFGLIRPYKMSFMLYFLLFEKKRVTFGRFIQRVRVCMGMLSANKCCLLTEKDTPFSAAQKIPLLQIAWWLYSTRLEFLEAFGFKLFIIPSTCPHHSIYTCPQKFVYDNYVPYTLPKHCSSDL